MSCDYFEGYQGGFFISFVIMNTFQSLFDIIIDKLTIT